MKKILKQATALLIALALTLPTISAFALEPPSSPRPLRHIAESVGGTAEWDSENALIIIIWEGDTFTLTMGSNIAYRNGEPIELEFPITNSNDRAYISIVDAAMLFPVEGVTVFGIPEGLIEAQEADPTEAYAQTGFLDPVEEPGEPGEFDTAIATAAIAAGQVMEAFTIPGVTVAIVDAHTGFTWTGGFGYADTTTGRPIDGDTLFQIASTSKPFTAVAVMQLAEQGLLDLDAPITNYIPEFSQLSNPITGGDYSQITARMLLSNTSGITNNWMYGFFTVDGHYQGAMNDILDFFAASYMDVPADTMFIYANAGWTLLGVLVARIAGYNNAFEGFISYTNENIFAPLGMTSTSFEQTADMFPYLAMFYNLAGTQDPVYFTNALGAGSVVSSANDMAIFMHTILNGGTYNGVTLLSQASVNAMLALHDFDFSLSPIGYGLGFMHNTGADGFQSVGHGGTLIHHHTAMDFNLESGIGVFVSANAPGGLMGVPAIAGAVLQTAIAEKTGAVPLLPAVADPDATPLALTAEELAAYEGVYFLPNEMWVVEAADGILVINIVGMPDITLDLVPMSDGSFDSLAGRMWFEAAGDEMLVIIGDAKALIAGARADISLFMANEDFEQWIGTYYPVLQESHRSLITSSRFFVNELGMAVVHVENAHGFSPIQPLMYVDGTWYAGFNPIVFEMDEDGNASYEWLGARFERR